MKRLLFAMMAVTLMAGLTGCETLRRGCTGAMPGSCHDAPENCGSCGDCDIGCNTCATPCNIGCDPCGGCGGCLQGLRCLVAKCKSGCGLGMHGCRRPPVQTVGYPYYTLRGPRDYFIDNPPTIGP